MTRLLAVCSFAACLIIAQACSDPAAKLPVYGSVPKFQLTDSNGKAFDSTQLAGKVWVADFIYTHCPGPCPRMTSQMHALERHVKDDGDIRLVSFSVDPDRDTPPVLNEFAKRFGGPTERWFFLTGVPETLHNLARNVFKVGDLIAVMDHSTKFMLVDRKGQLRGYYSTFDADGMKDLLRDIESLRHSRS